MWGFYVLIASKGTFENHGTLIDCMGTLLLLLKKMVGQMCDKLSGLKGEVLLKRKRLSGEEELSNDNGTERWKMGQFTLAQVEGENGNWSLDRGTLETRM